MPFILRVKEFTNHRLWSLEKLQQGDLRKRFLCFCVIFFSMSFSETERTQFKDITVKYWLFTPLKNGLKMEESRLINSVACWNSSKHSTSPYLNLQVQLFSLGILGLFFKIKMQNWALSRQPNFNFFFFFGCSGFFVCDLTGNVTWADQEELKSHTKLLHATAK